MFIEKITMFNRISVSHYVLASCNYYFSTTASVNSENRTNNPSSKRFLTHVYSKLTPPTTC
jgi:hypothetical protein